MRTRHIASASLCANSSLGAVNDEQTPMVRPQTPGHQVPFGQLLKNSGPRLDGFPRHLRLADAHLVGHRRQRAPARTCAWTRHAAPPASCPPSAGRPATPESPPRPTRRRAAASCVAAAWRPSEPARRCGGSTRSSQPVPTWRRGMASATRSPAHTAAAAGADVAARNTVPDDTPLHMAGAATRRSPPAGPSQPRPQTRRRACQSGRLASTSPAGAWTPYAVSSAAVDVRAWSAVRQRARLTHQQALSPTRSRAPAQRRDRRGMRRSQLSAPWAARRLPPKGATPPAR